MLNSTCNSTLEDLRIFPTSEIQIAGSLTFHQLSLIIAAACTLFAMVLSFYLIMMHATHYTVPHEQKHIIRILCMVPIYAAASFLSLRFYWHAIYFQVISDCYEAFAISSFFSLLCHYIRPDLHEQKEYFRNLSPVVTPWVWPLNWFKACCGGERGPWRTPKSGLTWFNIIWVGIYQYCFIRVTMTVTAVVTQYFGRYCESSNSPVFSHIWIVVVESIAVTIAMYCVIQFYIQLRNTAELKPNQPFLKVLAIKLVIFLSFWQSAAISVGTSTLNFIQPNQVLAYPDIKVGIPSLLLCFEMACFAILHLWAFPYKSYRWGSQNGMPKKGGFLGVRALWDAMNIWDVVKGFGRGMRWLFVGVKRRKQDVSYQKPSGSSSSGGAGGTGTGMGTITGTIASDDVDMDDLSSTFSGKKDSYTGYQGAGGVLGMSQTAAAAGATMTTNSSTAHLPIANEFRASKYGQQFVDPEESPIREERAGLIQNAQPNPSSHHLLLLQSPQKSPLQPYRDYSEAQYDGGMGGSGGLGRSAGGGGLRGGERDDYVVVEMPDTTRERQQPAVPVQYYDGVGAGREGIGAGRGRHVSLSTVDEESSLGYSSRSGSRGDMNAMMNNPHPYPYQQQQQQQQQQQTGNNNPRNSTQMKIGEALWGHQNQNYPPR
ncbi:organic solute transporter Ostalpha-domain-containing protein [Diplogelasinospora grovesii]|uniref:Organic solute transporter Ostalpha-domain-containing protein n=1 Tax=Diplogelasinospora grovesii TaxID=303347 RepID=A0AAN6N797_9PEZI|nr:organic solute transporter Ostalpha-domain-containing protein [Diplogelasinospora grovesii]